MDRVDIFFNILFLVIIAIIVIPYVIAIIDSFGRKKIGSAIAMIIVAMAIVGILWIVLA